MQPASVPSTGTVKIDNALVNIRRRLMDAFTRQAELRDLSCMLRDGVGQGRLATWEQFLEKFDALCKLYSQVTDELDRSVTEAGLQSLVALPRALTDDPAQLPDLLRTKLDQDVEREFQDLEKAALAEKAAATGVVPVQARVNAFNDAVESALDQFQELRERLATPRPPEPQPPPTLPSASVVLAAITNGTGLKK